MVEWLRRLLRLFNPYNKDDRREMLETMSSIAEDVAIIRKANEIRTKKVTDYALMLAKVEAERAEEQRLFLAVIDHLDDMVWAKDTDGKYIMANRAFREKFCYGMTWEELKGRDDKEIAAEFKRRVGDANHTFGEVCANSDEIIKKTEIAREFLEYGNINGKLIKLVVNKSPVYGGDGLMFATCGSGRDITWLHDKLEEALKSCGMCQDSEGFKLLRKLFEDIEFIKEGNHVRDGQP